MYRVLEGKQICDDVVYMNPIMDTRLQRIWKELVHVDSTNKEDLQCCMAKLRRVPSVKIKSEAYSESILSKLSFIKAYGMVQTYIIKTMLKCR